MPPYILCPQCTRVPVARAGELCEECQRKAEEQQKRYDKKLRRLEQKPFRSDLRYELDLEDK